MFVIQCLIISLLCAISGNAFPLFGRYSYPMLGTSFGWYTLGRPLVGGALCGIILGDIEAGIKLGISVQLVYLAVVTPGGAVGMDVSFMAYPVIAIGAAGDMSNRHYRQGNDLNELNRVGNEMMSQVFYENRTVKKLNITKPKVNLYRFHEVYQPKLENKQKQYDEIKSKVENAKTYDEKKTFTSA